MDPADKAFQENLANKDFICYYYSRWIQSGGWEVNYKQIWSGLGIEISLLRVYMRNTFSPQLWQWKTTKIKARLRYYNWFKIIRSQWSCIDVRVGLWRKLNAEELMLLNCGVGEDSWESLGLQGDPTSPF